MKETKRNKEILRLINEGETFESIGKKNGISKERVRQIAVANGINRWDKIREFKNKKFNEFLPDIKANLPLSEIATKHSLTKSKIYSIYKEKTGVSLLKVLSKKRNNIINKKFVSGKTANKIISDKTNILDNPVRITTTNSIYTINTKNNIKRYPQIGDRSKGGTFQSKKAIKLIVKYRDKGFTCKKILKKLNKKGIKTVTGKNFKESNILQLYNYVKKNLKK